LVFQLKKLDAMSMTILQLKLMIQKDRLYRTALASIISNHNSESTFVLTFPSLKGIDYDWTKTVKKVSSDVEASRMILMAMDRAHTLLIDYHTLHDAGLYHAATVTVV
jgi:hypothetical protein